jgi:hypothetical protein
MNPTWFNFYHTPEGEGGILVAAAKNAATEFGGRILLSASITRTDSPLIGVGQGRSVNEPQVSNAALLVDLYEVCLDTTDELDDCWVTIELPPVLGEQESKHPEKIASAAFAWDDREGRFPPLALHLPPPGQCADIILSVYTSAASGFFGGTTVSKYMYVRIPSEEIYTLDVKPRWQEMLFATDSGEFATNAGCMLCSVNLVEDSDVGARPPRAEIEIERYVFRALISQAVNLPVSDPAGTTDGFVVVFFGPAMMTTPIYSGSICPSWHQILESVVDLPTNKDMRPDIIIYVLDKDENENAPLAMLRYSTRGNKSLPVYWEGPLAWHPLSDAPGGPMTQAQLLCGFELIPEEQVRKHPRTSILPPTVPYRVEIFVIGVRLQDNNDVSSPTVEVSWGRADTDRDDIWITPRKYRFSAVGQGGNGCYNFMEKISLAPCNLANDVNFQEWLEIKLLVDEDEAKDKQAVLCSATVHLTPHLPFVEKKACKKLQQQYRNRRMSELRRMDYDAQNPGGVAIPGVAPGSGLDMEGGRGVTKLVVDGDQAERILAQKEEELAVGLGWNYDFLDRSNIKALGGDTYSCVNEMDIDSFNQQEVKRSRVGKPGEDLEPEEELDRHVPAVDRFRRQFHWPKLIDTDDDGLGDHKDINDELERTNELPNDGMPYLTAPLFCQGPGGTQEVVGTFKYIVRIVDRQKFKEDGPEVRKDNEAWENKIRQLEDWVFGAKDLIIRAYILSAEGLAPRASDSNLSSYVWTSVAGDNDPAYSFKDQSTIRSHTLFPDFNVVHRYSKASFPEHCLLKLHVVERTTGFIAGGQQDEVIGSTMVDLEDRFFHSRYPKMVKDGVTPVEARRLLAEGSCFGRGHVRLWIDIMHSKDATEPKLLPSTEATEYELRLVIWKMTDIRTNYGGAPTTRIKAKMALDEGTEVIKETDDHKDTSDACATFNWRLIFPVKVPCRDAKMLLEAGDGGYLWTDLIGNVTLDFERDFGQAKRSGAEVVLPRGKVKIFHPDVPGQVRGVIELQGVLLHNIEAKQRVVGEGRDEPNDDPWLNPDDPHLLKGRVSLVSAGLENLGKAGEALWSFGKYALLIKVLIGVGSALAAGIPSLLLFINITKDDSDS